MKIPTEQRQAGFTLIELLIVMVIMSILSLTLANFIFGWMATAGLQQARANLQYDAQYALSTINTDIMLSGSVDGTNRWPDPNGPGGNPYGWQSSSTVLILAKVATDSSGNPIFIDTSNYVTQKDDEIYYLSGTTLYRRTLASNSSNDAAVTTCPSSDATSSCPPDKTIATGVSAWSVAYYDANNNNVSPEYARSVQTSITLTGKYGSEPISASYTTRMVFRND